MAKKKYDVSRHTKWKKKNDKANIILILDKSKRQEIKAAAESAGDSMNQYILGAVEQQMAIDRMPAGMGAIISRNGDENGKKEG